MSISNNIRLSQLASLLFNFSAESVKDRAAFLQVIKKTKLPAGDKLFAYHELLLFMAAHPANATELSLVEKELDRITRFFKSSSAAVKLKWVNSGFPFTAVNTHFSHDLLGQLLKDENLKVELISMDSEELDWNQLFRYTLPAIERSNTTAGYYFDELLEALKIGEKHKFKFILDQFDALSGQPLLKDEWFANLNMQVSVQSRNAQFSRTRNNFRCQPVFYHNEILKKINHLDLLNSPVPAAATLSEQQKKEAIAVVKNSLVLTARETDPCTYMDESSFRLYNLERGISVTFYTMMPERQLPLESYVGYTLLKNGFPAAYGGAWIFGERAHFGINIFESFRGGESGIVLCQLLRTYRQVFGINYFEVEPYQYGLDNPEGISSGAFWFYYRFGFRPLNKKLLQLSNSEFRKIKAKPGYRSAEKTLIQFTESNIGLDLGAVQKHSVLEISSGVSALIAKNFACLRSRAVNHCLTTFQEITRLPLPAQQAQLAALTDLLLMALFMQRFREEDLKILAELAKQKCSSPYLYQAQLKQWLLN